LKEIKEQSMPLVGALEAKTYSRVEDLKLLFKFRLTLMVVFTSILGYLIASGGNIHWSSLALLFVGGFAITAASNTLNEVLEKDFDALMSRTANRPLPAGRMSVSQAVIIAGLLAATGIIALALFNPLTTLLGTLSLVLYAFIYTPLKRYTSISVLVGAVPGALPALIGYVAFSGSIGPVALILFTIQFIWQMPHFWSIGWLGFEDYQVAGYKLLPNMAAGKTGDISKYAFIYTLALIPVSALPGFLGLLSWASCLALGVAGSFFIWKAYRFFRANDKASAKGLLYASLLYLPITFIVVLIDSI